jgi:inorganic pyrophosphatase
MKMIDNGMSDEKIIAIPYNDPTYNMYTNISELPQHIFNEMKHFFSVYKELEHKQTDVNEFGGPEEAVRIIDHCIQNYDEKFGK